MCGKNNESEIGKFSEADGKNYAVYEQELENFVKAVDPLLGKGGRPISRLLRDLSPFMWGWGSTPSRYSNNIYFKFTFTFLLRKKA